MAKTLARVLKTELPRLPLRKAAEELRKKGRGRDTVLAHITPKEAALLKARGGSGTINPDTGLPEFEDTFGGVDYTLGSTESFQPSAVAAPADTFQAPVQAPVQTSGPGLTPQELGADAAALQADYNALTGSQSTSGVAPGQELWSNYFNTPVQDYNARQLELAGVLPMAGASAGTQWAGPTGNIPVPTTIQQALAAPSEGEGAPDQGTKLTGESQATPEEQALGRGDKTVSAPSKGIQTPFGTLGLKEAIAALGIGGMGLNYLNAQAQGKKAAAQLQAAYNQAAQQSQALAQPFMQQGGQQLAQALQGTLSPAQQQQLQAAQAQAAQSVASSGGVAAAQAGRSVEDLRQRLLQSQVQIANSLLGAGTPLINQAIQNQLSGTVQGINTQMQLSQQAGQAASGMLGMLAMMYGRG